MRGDIPTLPRYAFMAWCSVKAQGQIYLYLTSKSRLHGSYHLSERQKILKHFDVEVLWAVTPCSVAVGYRRF